MKAAIVAMSSMEMGSYKASRVFRICLPNHTSHKIQPLDKAFMGPRKHSIAKKLKMIPFKPRAIRRRLPNWQNLWKRQASCNRRDSG
jgi:hypothetical protein